MTNYDRGADLERAVVNLLRSKGLTAFRSAGSKGPADVIAVGRDYVWLIQVKKGRLTPGERKEAHQKLAKVEGPACVKREVWMKHDGQWEVQTLVDARGRGPAEEHIAGPSEGGVAAVEVGQEGV